MNGTLKVTALLVNPDGVWEDTITVKGPDGSEKTIMVQFLASLNGLGLIRDLGDNECECIPMLRVKNIHMKLDINRVALDLNIDRAAAISKLKQ